MNQIVKITGIRQVTHDVRAFTLEKPEGFQFEPGQATDVSVNQPGLEEELRPFTFTCLPTDPYLEFTIKRYADHHGVTDKIHELRVGDELIIRDAWGAIQYKGPGYFIAGGAGLTPFMSIFRKLYSDNKLAGNTLFFSNKTAEDIIYHEELQKMLGDQAVFIFTREQRPGYQHQRIDGPFLQQHVADFRKHFYICGPDEMVKAVTGLLEQAGASGDSVIFEK